MEHPSHHRAQVNKLLPDVPVVGGSAAAEDLDRCHWSQLGPRGTTVAGVRARDVVLGRSEGACGSFDGVAGIFRGSSFRV